MVLLANRFCQQNKRKRADILVFIFIYFLLLPLNLFSTDPPAKNKVQVVVIDPGHGGKDPGAIGSKIREKDVVLDIGLKLGQYIEKNFENVQVIYTRKTDVFVELHERAQIANDAKADVFISIHANALPRSRALGTETFVIGRHKDEENFNVAKMENSVILLEDNYETKYEGFDPNSIDSYIIFSVMQKTYQEHSLALAKMVQDEFELKAKRINRGVKQAGFVVLWRTTMPSILVETGFLTHPEEEKFLGSQAGQDYLASAIFRAFRKYKNAIEQNSNFASNTVPGNHQAEPESSHNQEIEEVSDTEEAPSENIYFKVQVLVARNQIGDLDSFFKNYQDVEEFRAGNWYKYAVGKAHHYNEIESFCDSVRKEYPDAFVIGVKDGVIIRLNEALKKKKE